MSKGGRTVIATACGVTPQSVAMHARPPLLLTHAPGHMFLTDLQAQAPAPGRRD